VADDIEEGPDPNDVRRHAKKMLTEMQYRQKYRRIDFYRPNLKQMDFHNLKNSERMIRAGNQLGKTQSAAAQMTMDSLGMYPDWYTGRRFITPPAIERPYDFIGWYGCTTSGKTRDGAQVKLLGDLRQQGGLGTGLLPLDNIIGRPTMARGIADFVDTISLRREVGGTAVLRGKTFEMGREAWQGEPVDVVWGDEDPGDFEIYGECQARLTTTRGIIIWSMSPMLGLSPVRRHFKDKKPGTAEVLMTIYDAAVSKGGHIPDEDIPDIIARYGSKAATRAFGGDMQGQGSVFETEQEHIKHTLDPASVPVYWPWMWALDFRHSGQEAGGHPFAAVLGCWDRDGDVLYIMDAFRMFGMAANHVARIRENPMRDAPVAWPHDGGTGAGVMTNDTISTVYKKLGLAMRPTHATFPDGGYNFEAGIQVMEERLAGKKLRVAAHLVEWFDEYQGYHRINGKVNKVDDDLLSATRVLCMDLRFARIFDHFPAMRRAEQAGAVAIGTDFDAFTGALLG
jgi:phage terminase large subunit-like protein